MDKKCEQARENHAINNPANSLNWAKGFLSLNMRISAVRYLIKIRNFLKKRLLNAWHIQCFICVNWEHPTTL